MCVCVRVCVRMHLPKEEGYYTLLLLSEKNEPDEQTLTAQTNSRRVKVNLQKGKWFIFQSLASEGGLEKL